MEILNICIKEVPVFFKKHTRILFSLALVFFDFTMNDLSLQKLHYTRMIPSHILYKLNNLIYKVSGFTITRMYNQYLHCKKYINHNLNILLLAAAICQEVALIKMHGSHISHHEFYQIIYNTKKNHFYAHYVQYNFPNCNLPYTV